MWSANKQKLIAADISHPLGASPLVRSAICEPRLIRSNCGATTPEIAVLTLAVMAAVIPAVGLLGQLTAHLVSDVGFSLSGSADPSCVTSLPSEEASPLAAIPHYVSWCQSASRPSMAVVGALALAWLVLRNKRPKGSNAPRPLAQVLSDTACDTAIARRQRIVIRLNNDTSLLLRGDLEVRHLMTDRPATVRPNATVQRACEIMDEQHLDYLLVCDANDRLLGLLSRYYLQRSSAKRVADAMLPNPLFVSPDATLSPTVTQMLNEGVSCVAVVEQGRAIGALTTRDIQLTLQAILQVLAKATCERRLVECETDQARTR